MNQMTLLFIVMFGSLIVISLVFFYFIQRELKAQNAFFRSQAAKRNGTVKKWPPFGFNFKHQDEIDVSIYVLQGSFYFKVKLNLDHNPAALFVRKYPYLAFLQKLNSIAEKKEILFHGPFDDKYSASGVDETWIKNVFTADILEDMRTKGSITRLVINQKKIEASFLILTFAEKETNKIDESIDICLKILSNIIPSDTTR